MKSLFAKRAIFLLSLLVFLLPLSCRQRLPETHLEAGKTFGIAPWSNPRANWELLGGYLPEDLPAATSDQLSEMDAIMNVTLGEMSKRSFINLTKARQCMKSEILDKEYSRASTMHYWQNVAKCMGVDYLVVPQLMCWRDRDGSAYGSRISARIAFSVFIVNAKTGGITNFYHFDEEQKSLSDDLLSVNKFFKRKGQWLTAQELASEAVRSGVKELGL